MNCTAIRREAVQGVDPWELTIVTIQILSLLFHLFCAYPIFKLARERFALYILVSKLFTAILYLLAILTQHAPVDDLFFNHIVTLCANFSAISNRLHIIALAANRAHAITSTPENPDPPQLIAHNRSWNTEGEAASASDKDSARITWTCFAIQIVTACHLSYTSASNVKWFNDFMLCDPIGKMRKNCRQLIGKVLPFTAAQVAATTDNDNGLKTSQTQNIKSVNVVGPNRRLAVQRSDENSDLPKQIKTAKSGGHCPGTTPNLCTVTQRIGRQQQITGHTMKVIVACKKTTERGAGLRLTGSFTKETRSALERGYKAARRECGVAVRKLRFELCAPPHDSKLDGPSATAAAVVGMLSLASHRRVRTDVAVTGDVGPTGRIRKVGCIRQKVQGAVHAGIRTVFLPHANRKNFEDIPKKDRKIKCRFSV
ncbi:hypothetical protein GPALN_011591 [Globodera pallida]|nr:hypothetical protein GPALN_011591 [Globodera pallida]